MTADIDGDFVVFLIGMRVNSWRKIHRWLPVVRAMPAMMRSLYQHPELGFLGAHSWVGGRGTLMVQYWRTVEQLEAFAKDPSFPHHPAWREFNRRIRAGNDVGIWHETYLVAAGSWETVYVNLPRFGLGAAGAHVPVAARGETAAQRRGA